MMRPLRRQSVNKSKSATQFRKKVGRTNPANLKTPMRGGFRL